MGANIFAILACVPLYVINSFCDKTVSGKNEYNYIYNCIKFVVCSICMLPLIGTLQFNMGTLICGALCGIMYAISKTVMLKGYKIHLLRL